MRVAVVDADLRTSNRMLAKFFPRQPPPLPPTPPRYIVPTDFNAPLLTPGEEAPRIAGKDPSRAQAKDGGARHRHAEGKHVVKSKHVLGSACR